MFEFLKIDFSVNDISNVREQLLHRIFYLFSGLGFFALIAGGLELYYQGDVELVSVYIAAYGSVVCCLIFKKFLSYRTRAVVFLTSLYFLALFLLARIGLSGTGVHVLIIFSLFSTMFLGIRAGFKSVVLGLITIIVVGICMGLSLIPTDIATLPNSTQFIAWIVVALVFVAIGMMIV
ncbi:MAG: hypothetical protein GY707_01665, partial [Desulfobacteraceae bacterium]|nr:hypothetical protein [Desulfobacteraceae bacterium]